MTTGTVPPMDDPSKRSASLSPQEEAQLRRWVEEGNPVVTVTTRRLLAALDEERAINVRLPLIEARAEADAARTPRETPDLEPLARLIRRVEKHVDFECGRDGRYAFMEEVRVIAGDLVPHSDD